MQPSGPVTAPTCMPRPFVQRHDITSTASLAPPHSVKTLNHQPACHVPLCIFTNTPCGMRKAARSACTANDGTAVHVFDRAARRALHTVRLVSWQR